ncbi:alpha-1,3-mannosyl-glycoprotein 2-beta-N-acetylglucosaminyltransferase b isoform X1 [Synchiropus splendidus]|uniref:alpha-1,3-mannosyl-glycoprotein 2-beta-N-acetylglucosaminyltransferase b isoform X1 n=1 Tax=Synchiropus splendidus TaxID=270530 RepID=UPI00237DD732|nr:alpha-1,3-mannosyl-glycoprotein 2-beta-N-acetylglucosaminyltransferase b isoform X1 [Synchiropus splendidus]XP_053718485.1 alpha-1,3-mannosyl-glycoprotein 2-beta-N-acetylglucosaminyltransferase b isoform X1 [Synchiropus splendidus]
MVRKKGSLILCGAFLFVAWNALLLLYLWGRPPNGRLTERGGVEPGGKEEWGKRGPMNLAGEVIRLAEEVEAQLETQKKLLKQIENHRAAWAQQRDVEKRETNKVVSDAVRQPIKPPVKDSLGIHGQSSKAPEETAATMAAAIRKGSELVTYAYDETNKASKSATLEVVIPILVIACDRVTVKRSLDKLIQYRPSPEAYPIIVSQDCGHAETARVIDSYGQQVTHIKQPDLSDIRVRPEHRKFQGYYKIARHYRWALNQVFRTFSQSTVVIVEDDLEVSVDFYEYFRALYPILRADPSLWCVSAWNDNGRDALVDPSKADLLHRTDFFPGLGWMLLKEMWDELEPKWPSAFWDDWMRQPEQRKDRSCIRPEISRTITFGRKGVSLGQFFDQYLRYIKLNTEFVPFTKHDLSYLLRENYDDTYVKRVYSAPLVKIEDLQQGGRLRGGGPYRVQYSTRESIKVFARNLGVMDDLKSGVPRTGYRGIVSFLHRGRRVYLAPPEGWTQYDPSWS